MTLNPEMRASDADRDRVAVELREHCAQGRIGIDELDGRLEAAYAARTIGELRKVTEDLPEEDMYELPVPAARRSMPARRRGAPLVLRGTGDKWASYVTVNLVLVMIWLITAVSSGSWYPWWLWVAGPWGGLLILRILSRHDRR
jgi:hypothetical protein